MKEIIAGCVFLDYVSHRDTLQHAQMAPFGRLYLFIAYIPTGFFEDSPNDP